VPADGGGESAAWELFEAGPEDQREDPGADPGHVETPEETAGDGSVDGGDDADAEPDLAPDTSVPCICGDGQCIAADPCNERWDSQGYTCAADCAVCGNGTCDPGEGTAKCPTDCCGSCGDDTCKAGACTETPLTCPALG